MGDKALFIDASSGISGDMFAGALLDLGADMDRLRKVLEDMPDREHFRVERNRVKKSAIDCCSFDVILDEAYQNHDHDMAYLYGNGNVHASVHREHASTVHAEEENHGHTAAETHAAAGEHAYTHAHMHRTLREVREILGGLSMSPAAAETADRIFSILAEAEARAHGVTPEEVHFHEVGALDSIVDIVAAAVCLDDLGIRNVIIPRLTEGTGTVRTQHGLLPVPVPAVVNIAEASGIALEIRDVKGEYVTPTGAAIAAAIRTSDHLPPRFRIVKTGLGAGKREQELPGFLRVMIIEEIPAENKEMTGSGKMTEPGKTIATKTIAMKTIETDETAEAEKIIQSGQSAASCRPCDSIVKLETNIDDSTGEALGHVMQKLLQAGARDVYDLPVYMKKNRPGWMLSVLCDPEDVEKMEDIIFAETSTIGVRRVSMERTCLPRRKERVLTRYGDIDVKVVQKPGGEVVYPEYESAAAAAEANGVPLPEVYREVMRGKHLTHGRQDNDGEERF